MREVNRRCKGNESKVKDKERRGGNEDMTDVTWGRRRYTETEKRQDLSTDAEDIRGLASRYDTDQNQRTGNRRITREIKFSYCERPEN